jgi:LmbE family N-acetylglucosaminyl deacetylase
MKLITLALFVLLLVCASLRLAAQEIHALPGADERFKADILVVVAHPDDEGGVTPYLARAIYDEHKRVAVVFGTRGGSGVNEYGREHGPAMANIREIEARQACAKLGISNVWFLDGKDTASQNVLNSLASWGHGANLEKLVGLIRLTRPEVMISWLPGVFIGENHGDHQASGVLATEAFDIAGDSAAFPAQLAGDSKRLEPYLENLQPWQPKKIFYFSDAQDEKQFVGKGPAYSVKQVSPSQKKPYWRLAMDAALPHRTQFSGEIERINHMSDVELDRIMSDPNTAFWTEPQTLILGKSLVGGAPTDDVFANVMPGSVLREEPAGKKSKHEDSPQPQAVLGGPWLFYTRFRAAHGLANLPQASTPEIGLKAGSTLWVPLVVFHASSNDPLQVTLKTEAPDGWKVVSGEGEFELPAETSTALHVEIDTPTLTAEELKKAVPQEVTIHVTSAGKSLGDVELRVLLRPNALPH